MTRLIINEELNEFDETVAKLEGKYNGWEDPAWRDYWGMNDEDEPEEIEEQ